MGSNRVNLVHIFPEILLISCLVLLGFPNVDSNSNTQSTSERRGELGRDPKLSSPEECARTCYAGEPPKTCYWHFTVEVYTVLGRACETCTPNNTSSDREKCQCVLADGVERTILSVNRMLPGPSIEVCKGDMVVIDVENHMEGMEITIHWHGLFQNGYQYYDGVPFVTQCPTSQFNTFRYQFVAANAGTHFWHSHSGLQKMDGIYGSFIVRETFCSEPNRGLYDKDLREHVILISDWMHELAASRYPGHEHINPNQTPESALINGKGRYTNRENGSMTNTPLEIFTIKPGLRYRFRMINAFCSVCPAQLKIEGHAMTIIAADGESVHPVKVNTINSFAGERYDFNVDGKNEPGTYWIQLRALGECGVGRVQQLAMLRYEGGPDKPFSKPPPYDEGLPQGVVFGPLDANCEIRRKNAVCITHLQHANPIDKEILESHPDVQIFLPFRFHNYQPEQLFRPYTYDHYLASNHALVQSKVNGISFVFPPSPPLSQLRDIPPEKLCNSEKKPAHCADDGNNCTCTHRIHIPLNTIVEIVLIDEVPVTNLSHPFHLHGYAFNVVGMGRSPDKNVTKITMKHVRNLDQRGLLRRNWDNVPYKDTIPVPNNGYVILRFRADNPGEWLFHCHFIYHTAIGMDVIMHVGEPKDLPPVPHGFPKCGNFLPPITHVHDDSTYSTGKKFHGDKKLRNASKLLSEDE